jgi:hypothetical protein
LTSLSILFSGHPGISVNELSPLSLRRWNIRHFKFDFHRLKMADSLLLEEVTSSRKREYPIYFFTSPSGIQLIISASPNVEITSPGRRASGFFNPCGTCSSGHNKWVSQWLLFSANSAIFQLYHGENKLIFCEMMMRSALY